MPDKPIISIVDDDDSARQGTMDLVKSMGFVAVAFPRAVDFLRSTYLSNTSCLIADVQIPGMTGIELYTRLLKLGKAIPTILITASPDDEDRARTKQAGVICYLVKPYDPADLLAGLQAAIRSRQ